MNVNDFVRELKRHIGKPYIYGGIGRTLTKAELDNLKKMYPSMYTDTYYNKALKFIGKQCFDCTGLIEYVLMGMTDSFQSSKYQSALDKTANGWIASCSPIVAISSTPPPIGSLLFKKGTAISHVGVYIGDGMNIQAKGIDEGVITETWNKTKWDSWGTLPYVQEVVTLGEHWAKKFYNNLVKHGVINDDETSRIWQDFNSPLCNITMAQFMALISKLFDKAIDN